MNRRRGSTLIEVLVAIFIMGIGLLAILAMFPLGALKMTQAIQDDRYGHCAANARSIAIARNLRFDTTIDPYFANPGGAAGSPLHQFATSESPSWAVFCDPFGVNSYSAASGTDVWLAGAQKSGGIARVSPGFIQLGPG